MKERKGDDVEKNKDTNDDIDSLRGLDSPTTATSEDQDLVTSTNLPSSLWVFHSKIPDKLSSNSKVELVVSYKVRVNTKVMHHQTTATCAQHPYSTTHWTCTISIPQAASSAYFYIQLDNELTAEISRDLERTIHFKDDLATKAVFFAHSECYATKIRFPSLFSSHDETPFTTFLSSIVNDCLTSDHVSEQDRLKIFFNLFNRLLSWYRELETEPPCTYFVKNQRPIVTEKLKDDIWPVLLHLIEGKEQPSEVLMVIVITLWNTILSVSMNRPSLKKQQQIYTSFLDNFEFSCTRRLKELVPEPYQKSFISGLKDLLERNAESNSLRWLIFVPFIRADSTMNLTENVYAKLLKHSRNSSSKVFEKSINSFAHELSGLEIQLHDLKILIDSFFDSAPTMECTFMIYKFAGEFEGGTHLFCVMFSKFLAKYGWNQNSSYNLRLLKEFLADHAEVCTAQIIVSILENKELTQIELEQMEKVFDIIGVFLSKQSQENEWNTQIVEAICGFMQDSFNDAALPLKRKKRKSRAVQGVRQDLNQALSAWNYLLQIISDTQLQFYVPVLLKTFDQLPIFNSADSVRVLEIILQIEESYLSPNLERSLANKAVEAVANAVRADSQHTARMSIIDRVTKRRTTLSKQGDLLGSSILLEVIQKSTNDICVQGLIQSHVIWRKILEYPWAETIINHHCKRVLQVISDRINKIQQRLATFDELKEIVSSDQKIEIFINLAQLTDKDASTYAKHQLENLQSDTQIFETVLADMKFFYHNFCQNDLVDGAPIWNTIQTIEKNISTAPFYQLRNDLFSIPLFDKVKLFRILGSNELYLKMYTRAMRVYHRQTSSANMQDIFIDDEEEKQHIPKYSIQTIASEVFPAVNNEWMLLFNELSNNAISFEKLHYFFGAMSGDQVQSTLLLLRQTCYVPENAMQAITVALLDDISEYDPWVQLKQSEVSSFVYTLNQRHNLPCIMEVAKKFQSKFKINVSADIFYQNVQSIQSNIEHDWNTGTLEKVKSFIIPAKQILNKFSEDDIDLIKVLYDADDMLTWLFEKSDNEQFNQQIRVSRSVNDDALLLQSFASLMETRQYLDSLLYPQMQFLSVSTFFSALRNVNLTTPNPKEKIRHVALTKRNLDVIKESLARVTASPGVQACLQVLRIHNEGQYRVTAANHGQVTCVVGENRRNMEQLLDLQTTLLNTKIPEELRSVHKHLDATVDKFVKQIQTLSAIESTLKELSYNGHLGFTGYNRSFVVASDVEELIEEARLLKNENSNWIRTIETTRDHYYYINYFNMGEIITMIQLLDRLLMNSEDEAAIARLISFFNLIQRNIDSELELAIIQWAELSQTSTFATADVWLINLAKLLDLLFADQEQIDIRSISYVSAEPLSMMSSTDTDVTRNLIILNSTEKNIPNAVFSIFAREGRLPEPEEVLMCDENTRLEDALLLFRRWRKAKLYQRVSRIYVLAGIHRLGYTLQCSLVDALKQFLPATDSSLMVIVGARIDKQRLANAFSSYIFEGEVLLEPKELQHAYKSVCSPGGYSGGIASVRSNICGGGKSFSILQKCYEGDANYARIPFRESISLSALIQQMNDISKLSPLVCFHLDIAPAVNSLANYILFELLIVGTLHDHGSGRLFHKKTCDSFYVEVPSTPGDRTLTEIITLCDAIPQEYIQVSPETLSTEVYKLVRDNACLSVHRTASNYEMQFVCKTLQAYSNGLFLDPQRQAGWDPDTQPNMTGPECYSVLVQFTRTKQPSFALLSNFIKFTYPQFRGLLAMHLLDYLCMADPLWKDTKQIIISLILEATCDFAVRQIELNFKQDPTLEQYAERFVTLKKWKDSKHPVMVFHTSMSGETTGVDLVSLDPTLANRHIANAQLQQTLQENGIDLLFDFQQSIAKVGQLETEIKCLHKLKTVAGEMSEQDEVMKQFNEEQIRFLLQSTDFVMTVDNLMKMFAVLMRFQNSLPVIISGETGCGKSYLIQYLCQILNYDLSRFTLHGGHNDHDILQFIRGVKLRAAQSSQAKFVIFLDEVNTCNCLGVIKEIVCDRFLDGDLLPDNIKIVCALNPYRKKTGNTEQDPQSGLIYKHASVESIPDPLEVLAYRVFPVPDTFCEYLFDFGTLDSNAESHYINSMLRKNLQLGPSLSQQVEETVNLFAKLLSSSQDFIRGVTNEVSSVSLREIERAIRLFKWFDQFGSHSVLQNQTMKLTDFYDHHHINTLMVETLGHVYYCRLSRKNRKEYLDFIYVQAQLANSRYNFNPRDFRRILLEKQIELTKWMKPNQGIALNEALCENVFMIVTSALNKIPIFIVGPPGSSKSLAIDLISKAMKGRSSSNESLKKLPSFDVFTHQCSPLSTASGIEKSFQSARSYAKDARNSLVVLVLDEIGLAEASPFMPLKVLHQELEQKDIAVVAISNFSLDAAKMNRAVFLLRSTPTKQELEKTAKGIVHSVHLDNYLRPLAEAYKEVYDKQAIKNFFGLREFYYLVKYINNRVTSSKVRGLAPELLLNAVLRNFGGRGPKETEEILKIFSSNTMNFLNLPRPSHRKLIEDNLSDLKARHLMLLTQNNAALSLLFDYNILPDVTKTELIFGQDFPGDKTNFNISLDLQKIKLAMAAGNTCVLIHADSLYEALYDLLNQHYVEVENLKYARLAFGSSSVTCPVHDNFRIIVITELKDVEKLSAPFLNRLEKQIFLREHLLTSYQQKIVAQLELFVKKLKEDSGLDTDQLFIGSHSSSLTSLVQSLDEENEIDILEDEEIVTDYDDVDDEDILSDEPLTPTTPLSATTNTLYEKAISRLIYTMPPESVLATGDSEIISQYFKKQSHTDLNTLLDRCLSNRAKSFKSNDTGLQLVVTTYSPLDIELESSLNQFTQQRSIELKFLQLHEMQSSVDLTRSCDEFMNSSAREAMLVLVCDPVGTSLRRIRYAQYELETKKHKCQPGLVRHIVLIVNVMRSSKIVFTFDFDKRWNYAFVDDVRTIHSKLPSTAEMISQPFSELIEKRLDLIEILYQNIHNSLARLVYPFVRTKQEIQAQIQLLKTYLQSGSGNEEKFASIVRSKIFDLLKHSKVLNRSDALWFTDVVSNTKELHVSGTFRSALHHYIQRICFVAFSAILAETDKNSNMALLTRSDIRQKDKDMWFMLFDALVQVGTLEPIIDQLNLSNHIDIRQDERIEPFSSRFPFSSRVCSYIHSFRSSIDIDNPADIQLFIQKQLDLSYRVLLHLDEQQLTNYILDYHSMFSVTSVNNTLMLAILKSSLRGKSASNIAQIQTAYWSCESRFTVYANILSAIPEIKDEFLVLDLSEYALADIDSTICQMAIQYLNPEVRIMWDEGINTAKAWMTKVSKLRDAIKPVLSEEWKQTLFSDETEVEDENEDVNRELLSLQNHWKRTMFFSQFLRDLAIPEQFESSICIAFWKDLNDIEEPFNNSGSLFALLKVLTQINKEYSRNGDEFECVMCYSIPEELRRTKCCKCCLCKECAEEFISDDKFKAESLCMYCRQQVNLETIDDYTVSGDEEIQETEEARSKEQSFIRHASILIERFLVDYCLSNQQLSPELITSIIKYASKDYTLYQNSDTKLLNFIVSDSMLSSVVRRLLRLRHDLAYKTTIEKSLAHQLARIFQEENSLEFPLAVAMCQVQEDLLNSQSLEVVLAAKEKLRVEYLNVESIESSELMEAIYSLAYSRCIIKHIVSQLIERSKGRSKAAEELFLLAEKIFSASENSIYFFLREISTKKGISYAKKYLHSPAIKQMSSIRDWIAANPSVNDFMLMANVLRDTNPFITFYYRSSDRVTLLEVEKAVSQMHAGDPTALERLVMQESQKIGLGKMKAYLLMSVLENVVLLKCKETVDTSNVLEWLSKMSRINWLNESVIPLLRNLIGNKIHPALTITRNSSMDTIMLVRCVIHIIASILWNGVEKAGSLNDLLTKPSQLFDIYLPTMPDDSRQAVASFLGRGQFYECPQGHTYFVDACGKPMEESTCPYCKSQIGGSNHVMLNTNKVIGVPPDQSPKRYCLQDYTREQEIFTVARNLKPKELRALRFVLHSILLVAHQCYGGLQNDFVDNRYASPQDLSEFFGEHLLNDWKLFSKVIERNFEESSVLIHVITHNFMKLMESMKGKCSLKSLDRRQQMENDFSSIVRPILDEPAFIDKTLKDFYETQRQSRKQQESSADVFMRITDTLPSEMNNRSHMSSFWMYFEEITLNHFALRLEGLPASDKQSLAVIRKFCNEEMQLRATRNLVDITTLLSLVLNKFNKRITKEQAQEQSIAEVIESLKPDEQRIWSAAWEGFKTAWNRSWKYVEQYKCLQIPAHMKKFEMHDDTKLIYLLPNENDESIFCIAFVHHLISVHNSFIDAVIHSQGIDESNVQIVSSRHLTSSNLIKYSIPRQIVPYLKDHCNRPLSHEWKRGVEYDFGLIQQFVIDHVFTGVPKISAELRIFEFLGDLRQSGARDRLAARLTQEELSDQCKKELIESFDTSEKCSQCFRVIEMAIRFLQSTGSSVQFDSHVRDVLLIDYLKNNLLIEEAGQILSQFAAKTIRLKHLDSAWTTLENFLTADIFGGVDSLYKSAIPSHIVHSLEEAIANIPDVNQMLAPLRDTILSQLTQQHTRPSESLVTWLSFIFTEDGRMFSELTNFHLLPVELGVCHAMEVYHFIERFENNKDKL